MKEMIKQMSEWPIIHHEESEESKKAGIPALGTTSHSPIVSHLGFWIQTISCGLNTYAQLKNAGLSEGPRTKQVAEAEDGVQGWQHDFRKEMHVEKDLEEKEGPDL